VSGGAKSTQLIVVGAAVASRWQQRQQTSASVDGRALYAGLRTTAGNRAVQTAEDFADLIHIGSVGAIDAAALGPFEK